jgi:hypothetical protein
LRAESDQDFGKVQQMTVNIRIGGIDGHRITLGEHHGGIAGGCLLLNVAALFRRYAPSNGRRRSMVVGSPALPSAGTRSNVV